MVTVSKQTGTPAAGSAARVSVTAGGVCDHRSLLFVRLIAAPVLVCEFPLLRLKHGFFLLPALCKLPKPCTVDLTTQQNGKRARVRVSVYQVR